jgi:tetratricopeptide (TPR) repeat protein
LKKTIFEKEIIIMADKKQVVAGSNEAVIAKAQDFWTKYNKQIMIACTVIIVAVGGWFIYQNFFKNPKEAKARDAMWKAEEYYRIDSVNLALNGDGQNPGFLRIISQYKGTKQAKLANFYAGSCYIKLNDNEKALSHLKKASTSSKPLQARIYKLMGDAAADLGKNADALGYYKKAASHFESDPVNSAEALFMAAYFADRVMKNTKEAVELYTELKQKFPVVRVGGESGSDLADKYLAQLGVYSTKD